MHNTAAPIVSPDSARPAAWGAFAHTAARILLALLGIQAARAAITVLLWFWLRPGPFNPLWNWIDIASFTIIGLALLILYRPSVPTLGLDWRGTSRLVGGLTIGFGALALTGILTSGLFDPLMLLENAKNALVLPIFEELIFRGWAWNRLETAATRGGINVRAVGPLTWLVNATLFALWHLGYYDIYLLKAFPASPGLNPVFFVIMKLAVTFVIGLMVGFLRWRTRRVYGSLVLHALINLFGR